MGLVNDRTSFIYRRKGNMLEFRFSDEPEPRRTSFRLEHGRFRHPYKGELPCAVMVFAREPYFTSFGNVENVTYYQLPEDE